MWGALVIVLMIASTGAVLWYMWSSNLPYLGSLREYNPPIITEIYSDDGEVMGRFWEEKRILVSLDQLPKHLINAFIAAEDARFFQHETRITLTQPLTFCLFLRASKKTSTI